MSDVFLGRPDFDRIGALCRDVVQRIELKWEHTVVLWLSAFHRAVQWPGEDRSPGQLLEPRQIRP